MSRRTTAEVRDVLIDGNSWCCWDIPIEETASENASPHHARLATDCAPAPPREAITTGAATVAGHRVALMMGEFDFLGGSIGAVAAERLVSAIRRATAESLPVIALTTSGGTRMQEGTPAFLQMLRITGAVNEHKAANLPYLVYLRNPTTGGVFASWGSLGHITFAEPDALIGFLGPRVYRALRGIDFPSDVQTAENLHAHGLVDSVVPLDQLREKISHALSIMTAPVRADIDSAAGAAVGQADTQPAWVSVAASRVPDRPGCRELIEYAASSVLYLSGTGHGEFDPGLLLALSRIGGVSCVLIGQDRHAQVKQSLGPAALRTARRGMQLASQLRLPLVSIIDTSGAELSKRAEENGLASEIAGCISDLICLDVPTLSVLLGEGAGGGALALAAADVVIAAEHAWLSPLPPEGASAIMFGDTSHAADMAQVQRIRSIDLLTDGFVDVVVPEPKDSAADSEEFCRRLGSSIAYELNELILREHTISPRQLKLDGLGHASFVAVN